MKSFCFKCRLASYFGMATFDDDVIDGVVVVARDDDDDVKSSSSLESMLVSWLPIGLKSSSSSNRSWLTLIKQLLFLYLLSLRAHNIFQLDYFKHFSKLHFHFNRSWLKVIKKRTPKMIGNVVKKVSFKICLLIKKFFGLNNIRIFLADIWVINYFVNST